MNRSVASQYQDNIAKYSTLLDNTNRRIKAVSFFRLLDFLLAIILIYLFSRSQNAVGIIVTLFLSITIFVYLVKIHAKLIAEKNLNDAKIRINTTEVNALNGNYDDLDKGEEFMDPNHAYSFDLDIFGEGSLFQILNRNATLIGRTRMANKLTTPNLENNEITENQNAINELSNHIDWRQHFQAIGITHEEKEGDDERIKTWVKEPPIFKHWIFNILLVLIPALTCVMIYFLASRSISVNIFLLYLVIPWGVSGSFAFKVNKRHQMVSKTSKMLGKYAKLLKTIEENSVQSAKLKSLQQNLQTENGYAGKNIKQLSAILTALDNRLNFVSWALFNGLMLWDILQMKRLEKWQELHRNDVNKWFEVVAELDALNGFANLNYNFPDTTFPVIDTGDFLFSAKQLGHPLINKSSRINNDINIEDGEFLIITGANMAGKSTFLRTVVVNMILGMCGGPVCAEQLSFTPRKILTSIRTNDSLFKNESYFYSELKRLKWIIDELKSGKKLFIVLDEILKGTNSRDKHTGSEALLKQFVSLKTTGIVATHDVALGKLEDSFPKHIKNRCFEVEINGSELTFDYKLRDGVSKNLNATILMREMGITL